MQRLRLNPIPLSDDLPMFRGSFLDSPFQDLVDHSGVVGGEYGTGETWWWELTGPVGLSVFRGGRGVGGAGSLFTILGRSAFGVEQGRRELLCGADRRTILTLHVRFLFFFAHIWLRYVYTTSEMYEGMRNDFAMILNQSVKMLRIKQSDGRRAIYDRCINSCFSLIVLQCQHTDREQ
jgi:hypothetical protein